MAYVICEPCIGVKDKACVAVCPVDCIQEGVYEGGGQSIDMLFINPDDDDWLEQVHELTGDLQGADLVIEASGYPYYQERALRAVRRFGTMWMYGFLVETHEPYPMHLLDDIHNRGVRLTGSHDVFI